MLDLKVVLEYLLLTLHKRKKQLRFAYVRFLFGYRGDDRFVGCVGMKNVDVADVGKAILTCMCEICSVAEAMIDLIAVLKCLMLR